MYVEKGTGKIVVSFSREFLIANMDEPVQVTTQVESTTAATSSYFNDASYGFQETSDFQVTANISKLEENVNFQDICIVFYIYASCTQCHFIYLYIVCDLHHLNLPIATIAIRISIFMLASQCKIATTNQ